MEFCISNKEFKDSKNITGVFVKGDYIQVGNKIIICAGYLLDEEFENFETYINAGIKNYNPNGIFGIIEYDSKTGEVFIKGDKWGLYSIYIFEKDGLWGVSNNIWTLVEEYKQFININQESLISQLVYITDVVPGRTIFNCIKRLPYGMDAKISKLGNIIYNRYWNFEYNENKNLSKEEVFRRLDSAFTKTFALIKKRNPDLIMGIGCSGGLDSRIIMHYVNKVGIPHTSYVFCQEERLPGIKTATYLTSQGVAEIFGDKVDIQSMTVPDVLKDSMLLDIRNQPFCTSQIYKNLYFKLKYFDFMMTGQPGGAMKTPESILTDDEHKIAAYTSDHLGNRMNAFGKFIYFLRKVRYSFPYKYDSTKETGITGLKKSLIHSIISEDRINKANEELFQTIELVKGKNGYETWQRLQSIIVHSMQYGGGYESLSNLKTSYYLYLPSAETTISNYIPTKDFLKEFIHYINPKLAAVPDQKLNRITDGRIKNRLRQVEYILRGQGINIEKNIKSKEYQKFAYEIMERDNPIFYKWIDKNKIMNTGILKTPFSATLVKKKLITDIFYYGEFDLLNENKEWIMA
ncbi:MAG: hypothetical protein HDS71_08300 [Bacteroidales bacterium]|nr:hypothetical protein [Bacteroidales bacterium]